MIGIIKHHCKALLKDKITVPKKTITRKCLPECIKSRKLIFKSGLDTFSSDTEEFKPIKKNMTSGKLNVKIRIDKK